MQKTEFAIVFLYFHVFVQELQWPCHYNLSIISISFWICYHITNKFLYDMNTCYSCVNFLITFFPTKLTILICHISLMSKIHCK